MNFMMLLSLIIIGLILIAIELLFIPGITYFGIIGSIALILGMIFAFVYLPLSIAALLLLTSVVIVIGLFILVFKFGFRTSLSLKEKENFKEGYKSFSGEYNDLLGAIGKAITDLRPAGKIMVNDRLISALTLGDYIEKNQEVKVIKIEGTKIIVKLNYEEV